MREKSKIYKLKENNYINILLSGLSISLKNMPHTLSPRRYPSGYAGFYILCFLGAQL